jgi:inner membrane transporter RhtA
VSPDIAVTLPSVPGQRPPLVLTNLGDNLEIASLTAQKRPTRRARIPVHALVLASISSVQLGAAWATTIFHQVGPSGACLLRLASASVVMLALTRPRVRTLSRRQWVSAGALGLVLAAMNLTFYHAISRIPLGTAVTIEFIGPLLVALAGSRRARDLIWAALAAGGIIALCHGVTRGTNVEGLILAAAAGVFWGAYILLQAQLGRAFDNSSGLALSMTVATVVALPLGVAQGASKLLAPGTLAIGAAVGMLSSAIPYSLELSALRRLSTATFGVLMSLEPAVAAVAGAILLGQVITLRDAVGIGLVVAASLGTSLTSTAPIEPLNIAA